MSGEISTGIAFHTPLSVTFFSHAKPPLSNPPTSVHLQLQLTHIEVMDVLITVLSYLKLGEWSSPSLCFSCFHVISLRRLPRVVTALWFSCASWLCVEFTLSLIHLSSSSPCIWRLSENTPVSTQQWSLGEKEGYSFVLQMDRTI